MIPRPACLEKISTGVFSAPQTMVGQATCICDMLDLINTCLMWFAAEPLIVEVKGAYGVAVVWGDAGGTSDIYTYDALRAVALSLPRA